MTDMIEHLKSKARKEIRYAQGYQVMHRERYLEYLSDMHQAREHGDVERQTEIAHDLKSFVGEMWHLMRAQQSAFRRLKGMARGHTQPTAIIPDTATPAGKSPHASFALF